MTPEERKASAERVEREPFFKEFIRQERQRALDLLSAAKSHEDLLRAQAVHQAAEEIQSAVRRATKR